MKTSEARPNVYFNEETNERVKISLVHSSGLCVIRNKNGVYSSAKIGVLKRIY
jgi:hypothetical protein